MANILDMRRMNKTSPRRRYKHAKYNRKNMVDIRHEQVLSPKKPYNPLRLIGGSDDDHVVSSTIPMWHTYFSTIKADESQTEIKDKLHTKPMAGGCNVTHIIAYGGNDSFLELYEANNPRTNPKFQAYVGPGLNISVPSIGIPFRTGVFIKTHDVFSVTVGYNFFQVPNVYHDENEIDGNVTNGVTQTTS